MKIPIFASQFRKDMKKISIGTILLSLLVMGLFPTGCKKPDDTDSTPYLSGSMTFDIPYYARQGEKLTIRPYGVSHPEGGSMKVYAYGASPVTVALPDTIIVTKGKIDKGDLSFTFTMPDSLGNFVLNCVASADGYYSRSMSADVTVISPEIGMSITGSGIDRDDAAIIDDRTSELTGERTYYYTTIGDLDWFRNNLAYTELGHPYLRCEVMSYVMGRYYTYEEALAACPEGWRLPTEEEWIALGKVITGKDTKPGETIEGAAGALMADMYFNGEKMWEFWPAVKITNQTKLAVLPAGYADVSGESPVFSGGNEYAAFWTATPDGEGKAFYRYINVNKPDIFSGSADTKSLAVSVRCVRETEAI